MNDFVAGLVGGLGGLVVGHPLDTVKALMQTSNQTNIISSTKNIIKNTSVILKLILFIKIIWIF
jgi:hypothetical protein